MVLPLLQNCAPKCHSTCPTPSEPCLRNTIPKVSLSAFPLHCESAITIPFPVPPPFLFAQHVVDHLSRHLRRGYVVGSVGQRFLHLGHLAHSHVGVRSRRRGHACCRTQRRLIGAGL